MQNQQSLISIWGAIRRVPLKLLISVHFSNRALESTLLEGYQPKLLHYEVGLQKPLLIANCLQIYPPPTTLLLLLENRGERNINELSLTQAFLSVGMSSNCYPGVENAMPYTDFRQSVDLATESLGLANKVNVGMKKETIIPDSKLTIIFWLLCTWREVSSRLKGNLLLYRVNYQGNLPRNIGIVVTECGKVYAQACKWVFP